MELVLQNPQATAPLRVRVDLECNTPEETILANVLKNSADTERMWIRQKSAHDRTAILVGNGPSLADSILAIRELAWKPKVDVFALNGACTYLTRRQIDVDYQVILDAQKDTRHLIGRAGCHLFASQVHPALFKTVPNAVLWHATYGEKLVDEQPGFDAAGREYCLIGGAASVGVTSLPLLYAMGYRKFKIFGMDSSNRGEASHARPQDNNTNDVYTFTTFRGVQYTCSLTMKAQAEAFVVRARNMIKNGCQVEVFGSGLLPAMWHAKMTEQEKYQEIWARQEYHQFSPGQHAAKDFDDLFKPTPKTHVVDLGCGTGRGGAAIFDRSGCRLTMIDFVNALDTDNEFTFLLRDITKPLDDLQADYVFCTDVMEHIPPPDVDKVIQNALKLAPTAFFQISLVPDDMGELIGQELHLSVHPCDWWISEFQRLGFKVPNHCDKGDIAQYVVTR